MEDLKDILKKRLAQGGPTRDAAGTSSSGNPEPTTEAGCPLCGGIGWLRRDVPVEHADFGRLFPCECRLRRFDSERYSRFLRLSNLGTLAGVTFEDLAKNLAAGGGGDEAARGRFRQGLEAAIAYAKQPEGWLLLLGPGGSGKTRLAAAIADQCVRQGTPVLFMTVADLLDHLRAAYAPGSDISYDELSEQVRNVSVLVLDDLGNQSATPWAQEKLTQILGHRYNTRAATVFTVGVPLASLDERFRLRLQDSALVRVAELGTPLARGGKSIDSLDLENLSHMTFENFDPNGLGLRGPLRDNLAEAKNLAMSFAERPEGWLVLAGAYGCGKTHLAAAIARYRRGKGDRVLFVFVPDLLDYLRSTFQSDSGSTYEVLDQVKRVGLLILDDFSEPQDTGWTREKLYQILNFRYLTRLPTVITSGVEPEQLDPRIWSRMNDSRVSSVYEIIASDYRTGIVHKPRRAGDTERSRSGRGRGRGPSV